MELDETLVGRVLEVEPARFEGPAYRHLGPAYHPLSGEGARVHGGRWNPPDSFPVLYLATTLESVIAEFYRLAERAARPPEDLLPRHLRLYHVELQRVLDLSDEGNRLTIGVSSTEIRAENTARCQAIGDAAHYAGFEAVLAPSATRVGESLAIFSARLQAGSVVEPEGFEVWNDLPHLAGGAF
jgi:RES domain-containing protein